MSRHSSERSFPTAGVDDFAFADTVVALDLDDAMPPSGIHINDNTGHDHYLHPIPHPLPAAAAHPDVTTRLRLMWARARQGVKLSRAEMNELWSATACLEQVHDATGTVVLATDPFVRAATMGRRVRTLFSFFEWDRADVIRATCIGLAVFVVVATAGVLTF